MATAPLYKRYIPPKPNDSSATKPLVAPVKRKNIIPPPPIIEKKRKRERPEEEVAERKAKKLRKKGVEATAETVLRDQQQERENAKADLQDEATRPQDVAVEDDVPPGEDVRKDGKMSIKKRHKLEKEARKARKEASKVGEVEGDDGQEPLAGGDIGGSLEGPNGTASASVRQDDTVDHGDAETVLHDTEKPRKRRKQQEEVAANGDGIEISDPAVEQDAMVPEAEPETKEQREEQMREVPHDQGDAAGIKKTADLPQSHAGTDTTPQVKKRRHKLESVLQQAEPGAENGEVRKDDPLHKHNAVLDKYQEAAKRSQGLAVQSDQLAAGTTEDLVELRDLAPIPQPEKAPTPEFNPNYSALPLWLANPTVISNDSKATFAALGLTKDVVDRLSKLGFTDASPIQQALIPLLLPPGIDGASFFPGAEAVLPDLAVSAATGSGKTIAYLLPIIEGLKRSRTVGKLSVLVVVPTRELVMQVAAVAESLASGSAIKVGTASGSGKLRDEQAQLIKRSQKYDPSGYTKLMATAHRRNYPPTDEEAFEDYLEELEHEDAREELRISGAVSGLADHVPTYTSAVDILVCTSGRVLEHVSNTLGFDTTRLDYLVLDEADKLLDQQFDGFIEALSSELPKDKKEQESRELYPRIRKVVLSATMTSDAGKLAGLRLFRLKMVVVRGTDEDAQQTAGTAVAGSTDSVRQACGTFELPPTLIEYCVPVGDGAEKPLFLIELLKSKILPVESVEATVAKNVPRVSAYEDSESNTDSESDAESASSSDVSSVSEDSEGSNREVEAASAISDAGEVAISNMHPARAALVTSKPPSTQTRSPAPTVLIFTSSTESTTRLSHLLTRLKPAWAPWISTLTKTQPSRKPRPKPSSPANDVLEPSITISTDRSARGLDTLTAAHRDITHVIQYDVPRSVEGYVHRVGRTARAGKPGEAWTLYTFAEARWFLHEVCGVEGRESEGRKACKVRRRTGVEKVKVVVGDEGLRSRFAEVLEGMRGEVFGGDVSRHE
ncbi:ATP-dependent RNA helicase dbp6 [Friedmanniomyces endolithicus]|uniref:ATP-dependent RNA helicase n=1 Tax=Friedmanniomyces endolithicus TaxID=329885 RepID=A0AAN6QUD3_9PEZI|nr:ATP-dependent RNA helicase dbp6 [Friedmanniomyces endolithicus]KAK0965131.1 ATP-dependent RNA helicase dbp6 [Friedmanniomyces endolithicus]KAK0992681.1 ATP-dependent RNA helicase dbp6 [Friedmanniomyces endolithicus]KAK1040734.1 ATP-dependent RNA helicase dbp6 [Friedmanniomyces endolithicus]